MLAHIFLKQVHRHENQLFLGHSGRTIQGLQNHCTSAMMHPQSRFWEALENLLCL